MASFVYTRAKRDLALATLDWNSDDIRVLLVKSGTTADTEEDAATISAFTTLDEVTDGTYGRKVLANEAVNEDQANDRAEMDADDFTWSALVGGETAVAMIVYKHITDDTSSIPIAYIDGGGFPHTLNGADLTINWNAEGILQLT